MSLYPQLQQYIQQFQDEAGLIPETRKIQLEQLASYLSNEREQEFLLNFICTHNSRRSHISQIWAATAAYHYGLTGVKTFSGGTEATAFNPRAVAAMKRAGFDIKSPGGENPHYEVTFADDVAGLICFSKTFDDAANPQRDFAAIMTCAQADEGCPFIPGASWRLALTYNDPKEADDTPEEQSRYDERVRQIGREIFYAFSLVQTK
ncbi:MAG: hypothetical protein MI974_12590 [Chitinophagales bacterium]|nr:hypothetical protein [Chitinophagales bacterium]